MDREEEGNKRKEDAILKELQLLEQMRKEHEWAIFGQKEAEEEEKIETELYKEIFDSTLGKPDPE